MEGRTSMASKSLPCRELVTPAEVDGQTALHSLVEVAQQLLEGLALGCAARYRGYLCPVASFFSLVDNDLELHGFNLLQ